MNLTIRILQPAEYYRKPIAELKLNPHLSIVAIAEDDETKDIKGYWVAQAQVHIEPIGLDPDIRDGGFTALKLFAALLAAFHTLGIQDFYSFADKPEISDYLTRIGLELTPYVTFRGRTPQCPSLPQPPPSGEASSLELEQQALPEFPPAPITA